MAEDGIRSKPIRINRCWTGGDIYIRANQWTLGSSHNTDYEGEWYGGGVSCNEAVPVTVTSGGNTANIDFRLNEGAVISGSVYESDEVTPVNGLIVYAYLEQCGETAIGSDLTDENGAYSIPGMPSGGVYLLASEDWVMDYNYIGEEWYNNAHSCDEADPVVAFAGEKIGNINFALYNRTDDDSNEMPDDWEVETFGDMSRDGTGDYDSDGITDLDEYLAGTDPTVSDSIADNETDTQGESGNSDGGGGCFITNVLHD
jgi:hypothetical protein